MLHSTGKGLRKIEKTSSFFLKRKGKAARRSFFFFFLHLHEDYIFTTSYFLFFPFNLSTILKGFKRAVLTSAAPLLRSHLANRLGAGEAVPDPAPILLCHYSSSPVPSPSSTSLHSINNSSE